MVGLSVDWKEELPSEMLSEARYDHFIIKSCD